MYLQGFPAAAVHNSGVCGSMSEKAKDKRLAFGAETGEVCDEELPKEIILLFQTSLRSFCLAEPTFAQDN